MTSLTTKAEINADQARSLPGFRDFSLPGVRDHVNALLGMIGRAEGIFSTYSLHDFSHIEAMLHMLDWLIPAETQEAMTPVDWLLITLGIYFHDLGLLVTSDEYAGRNQDGGFSRFMDDLRSDPDSRDYLSRADKMPEEEKDRFFFQEYVRSNHASRIREWISGRHNRKWPAPVQSIADEVARLVSPLPTRFIENLAVVCESHHKDTLDSTEFFPICQHYGSHVQVTANVQYAALLLRTADLLHVTRDRTPSEMFRLLKITDPKGIDEWKKQLGTFSVHRKGRELDPDDPASHIIIFSADFSEERPYFALAEYLAYANDQIRLTKRWSDSSQTTSDGKSFWFPWRAVRGDVRVEGNEPVQISFELDRGRLLNLLVGHTIYNDPTVAIRELLQNSIDATRFQAHLDGGVEDTGFVRGQVDVFWDERSRELVVRDRGTGMDLDVIKNHLMKVGSSFYDTPQFQNRYRDFSPISRFGIGVLACFMVSDDVEIVTCNGPVGYRIRMTSVHSEYLLKKLEPENELLDEITPHGTQVKLVIRESVDVSKRQISEILKHWILLPVCKVYYHENGKEPERIGYDSPQHLLENLVDESLRVDSEQYLPRIITKRRDVEVHQSYELAFQVRGGFTPERDFAQRTENQPSISAVCIEGIRTDDILPGLEKPNLIGILSVRGNQRFRTTVSRSTLERDEEYDRVAERCLEMLFEHLSEEVDRIAQKSGHPLSQASTAARWIFQTLTRMTSARFYAKVTSMYRKLPTLVVESGAETPEMDEPRRLLSQEAASQLPSFWTIESRLVDSLGIISRDLGRELSLHTFLSTLAPELRDVRLSPILHDLHVGSHSVLSNHSVASAEFSRHHQQSLLQWVRLDAAESGKMFHFNLRVNTEIEEHVEFMTRRMVDNGIRATSEHVQGIPEDILLAVLTSSSRVLYVAPVKGDIQSVTFLKTRVATIVDPSTQMASSLHQVSQAAERCATDDRASFLILSIMGAALQLRLEYRKYRGLDLEYMRSAQLHPHSFAELIQRTNTVLKRMGLSEIPERLMEEIDNPQAWFDASSYWRDWMKPEA